MGVPCDFHQEGYLFVVTQESELTRYRKNVALQQSMGADVRIITPDDARSMVPGLVVDDALAAVWGPTDGHVSPNDVVQAYAARARGGGVKFFEETPVTGIEVSGERVTAVQTAAGRVAARLVINAAGPQAPLVGKMVGLDLPVDPRRRHIFVTGSFPSIKHPMPLVTDTGSGFYCRSEQDAILMSPGDIGAHTEYTASVDWGMLEQTVEKAMRRLPVLEHAQIRHAWAGLHPDGAVEPYRLAVDHDVFDDVRGEGSVLGGPTKTRGERHLLAERDARGLREAGEERGVEETGGDGDHANAELGEIASDGQRHADDAALGGGVGGLADLAVEGGDGGGVDHHASLAFLVGLVLCHVRGGEPDAVEGADQVDLDRAREGGEIRGAALAVGFLRRPDARAVDEHVDGTEFRRGLCERARHLVRARDIARREERVGTQGLGHVRPRRPRQVEESDVSAASKESLGRGAAQSRGPARDHRHASHDLHRWNPPRQGVRLRGSITETHDPASLDPDHGGARRPRVIAARGPVPVMGHRGRWPSPLPGQALPGAGRRQPRPESSHRSARSAHPDTARVVLRRSPRPQGASRRRQ